MEHYELSQTLLVEHSSMRFQSSHFEMFHLLRIFCLSLPSGVFLSVCTREKSRTYLLRCTYTSVRIPFEAELSTCVPTEICLNFVWYCIWIFFASSLNQNARHFLSRTMNKQWGQYSLVDERYLAREEDLTSELFFDFLIATLSACLVYFTLLSIPSHLFTSHWSQ
jgi:hypothetical protein